jgi:hypothetical protein
MVKRLGMLLQHLIMARCRACWQSTDVGFLVEVLQHQVAVQQLML